jgi:hypothetical protein
MIELYPARMFSDPLMKIMLLTNTLPLWVPLASSVAQLPELRSKKPRWIKFLAELP